MEILVSFFFKSQKLPVKQECVDFLYLLYILIGEVTVDGSQLA